MEHGFDLWSRKIPHMAEQLSLCATTDSPQETLLQREAPTHHN